MGVEIDSFDVVFALLNRMRKEFDYIINPLKDLGEESLSTKHDKSGLLQDE